MIVLTTTLDPQLFSFIPRSADFDIVEITDDQTNETILIEGWTFRLTMGNILQIQLQILL